MKPLVLVLVILLLLALLGFFPIGWPAPYYPSGIITIALIVVLVLVLAGHI